MPASLINLVLLAKHLNVAQQTTIVAAYSGGGNKYPGKMADSESLCYDITLHLYGGKSSIGMTVHLPF